MAGRSDGGNALHTNGGSAIDFGRPPRDLHGHPVWRVKVVGPSEMTCLDCGETTVDGYCLRCVAEADADQRRDVIQAGRLVPTLSYLRPNEYERSN